MKRSFFGFFSLVLVLSAWLPAEGIAAPSNPLRYLPVQDGGRVKPFDTFANETLHLVYGRETYQGRPAQEIVMTWLLQPESWLDLRFIQISNYDLKQSLGLDSSRQRFAPNEISGLPRLGLVFQELESKRQEEEKLNPYFQSIQRLENQLIIFREIANGRYIRLVPREDSDNWLSVAELDEELQGPFRRITDHFIAGLSLVPDKTEDMTRSERREAEQIVRANLEEAVQSFVALARERRPEVYPSDRRIAMEIHYNDFHPFKWAWISYLMASLLLFLMWLRTSKKLYWGAWAFVAIGFILHTYGFGLRSYLTERAPVTNMYETVVWVSYGTILFAAWIEWLYRFRLPLLAGALVGTFCLILADSSPAVLDPTLQPLEPVLRSNFWLLVHVLTITVSYSAFFLALGLGNAGLIYYLRGEERFKPQIEALSLSIYRCVQVGVVLLAAGTILGGVWADYSWGRFWGWDPKETWALIALLGYLAVLHGRLAGWLKDFGMMVGSIASFSLVVMAWYGVNFVLGAGLHSYGFGAGGVEFVAGVLSVQFAFLAFVATVRNNRLKAKT